MDPFEKSNNNPVLQKNTDKKDDVTGTGHNMILNLPSGDMYCVYHGRTTKTGNDCLVFIDKIEITKDGELIMNGLLKVNRE